MLATHPVAFFQFNIEVQITSNCRYPIGLVWHKTHLNYMLLFLLNLHVRPFCWTFLSSSSYWKTHSIPGPWPLLFGWPPCHVRPCLSLVSLYIHSTRHLILSVPVARWPASPPFQPCQWALVLTICITTLPLFSMVCCCSSPFCAGLYITPFAGVSSLTLSRCCLSCVHYPLLYTVIVWVAFMCCGYITITIILGMSNISSIQCGTPHPSTPGSQVVRNKVSN